MAIFQEMCVYESLWKKSSVIKTCYESSHIYMYLNLYFVIILIMVGFFYRWTIK